MIAAGAGIVLILSLFLEWYNVSGKGLAASAGSQGFSGWESLGFIDILLFLIGVVAVALAAAKAGNALPRQLPASTGFITLVLGGIASLLVLFRILSTGDFGHPEASAFIDISRSFGIFIAFLAALGVTVGGWLTWNEEGKPKPGGAGAAGPGGAGAPLGQGQAAPYGGQPPAGGPPPQQADTPPGGGAAPGAGGRPAPAAGVHAPGGRRGPGSGGGSGGRARPASLSRRGKGRLVPRPTRREAPALLGRQPVDRPHR